MKMRQLCTVKAQGLANPEEQKQTLDAIIHEAGKDVPEYAEHVHVFSTTIQYNLLYIHINTY